MILCSFVIPCHNEEETIPIYIAKMTENMRNCPGIQPEYIFVDDGSADATLAILREFQALYPQVTIVELSRNFGKEAALSAGLAIAKGDIIIPMDADMQDPPDLVPKMISKWREGYDVVLAQRESRKSDSFFKRLSAKYFYKLFNLLSPMPIPENVGDFRLMTRKVVDRINALPESCRFMKGLFAFVGFPTTTIKYERPPRKVGQTKFNFWKLFIFSLDGITGFSMAPLRWWGIIGFCISFLAFCMALFYMLRTFFFGVDVPGYASLIVTSAFLGGMQLFGIGLLGEYLGRTYMESKNRPPYIINHIYRNVTRKKKDPVKSLKRTRIANFSRRIKRIGKHI